MTAINEVLDNNDPRRNRQQANPVTPPPVTAQPQPQLAAPPPQSVPPEPPAPRVPITTPATPDLYNQVPESEELDTTREVDASLPVISPSPVVGNDQESEDFTSVFPTVNDVNTDVAEQVAGNVDPGLQSFLSTAQNERLQGARYPFLTEIESERARLNRALTQSNNRLRTFIAEDARRQAARTLIQPINPKKSEVFKREDLNPGLDLDFTGGLENWNLGFFKSIKDRADAITGGNSVQNFLQDDVISRFRPLGSADDIRAWVADIKKNPWQLLNPIGVVGGQIHREGEFGDFGNGLLGAAFYGLSLYDNVITGGLVDLGNLITGKKNVESDIPNFIQGALGQDYSFTDANVEVTRTVRNPDTGEEEQITLARGANPLAVVGSREAPETIGDLKERSWLWKGVVGGLSALNLIDEDTPTSNLSGRLFQVPEFTTGLLLDVLIPSPGDFINIGKKIGGLFSVSPEAARVSDDVLALPGRPDRLQLPPAPGQRALPPEFVRTAEVEVLRPEGVPAPNPFSPRLESPAIDVPVRPADDALPGTRPGIEEGVQRAEVEVLDPETEPLENLFSRLETQPIDTIARPGDEVLTGVNNALRPDVPELPPAPPPIRPRRIIDTDAIDVPSRSVNDIDNTVSVREAPALPEADALRALENPTRTPELGDLLRDRALKQGELEESILAISTDLNKPLNPQLISTPSPIAALPPADSFGTGRTELFRRISKGELDDIVLVPEAVQVVRRSNSQLTQLAVDAGQIPTRNTPLSARRIELLNERYPGMFERYGQPLERVSRRDLAVKTPASLTRIPTADAIAAKFRAVPDVNLRTIDNLDDLNAARVADAVVDRVVNVPTRNLREIAEIARRTLPSDYADFDNLEEVSALLRNEQVYESIAEETNKLALDLREQVQALKDYNDTIDRLPDIGRRTLLNDADFRSIPPAPPPRRTPLPVNKALVDEIAGQEFLHGTKVAIDDFANIDPIRGASRSETGVGIHFTLNNDVAVANATKPFNRNVPSIGQRVTDTGRVFRTTITPRNLIDGNAGLTDEVKEIIRDATAQITNAPPNVRKNIRRRLNSGGKSFNQFINDIDDVLEKGLPDEPFPEEIALNLQRVISRNLALNGIDGVVARGANDTQITVFNPNIIKKVGEASELSGRVSNDPVSQALALRNASKATNDLLPNSKLAEVNFAESQSTLLTRMVSETSQQVEEVNKLSEAAAELIAEQESILRRNVRSGKKARRARQEQQWRRQNDDLIRHNNKPNDIFC